MKPVKKKTQTIYQRILTISLVLLLIAAGWMLYAEISERSRNKALQDEMRDLYRVTPTPAETTVTTPTPLPTNEPEPDETTETKPELTEPQILPQFEELLEINPDVIGWIQIPGTIIDYPVVQTDDNVYYLDHDIYGNPSRAGTLYMDYRMTLDGLDRHQIIYGHHMRDKTMFTDLMYYKGEAFFRENRYIYLDKLYHQEVWEIFSVYVTSTDFYYIETRFADDQDWFDFISLVQEKSKFSTDITLHPDDQVLTLSTCTYEFEDARFVVHARLITQSEDIDTEVRELS